MEFKDYYAVLGVQPDADDKTIRQAYRKLARQYHPDVNPGDKQAAERFKEINEAYEAVLAQLDVLAATLDRSRLQNHAIFINRFLMLF